MRSIIVVTTYQEALNIERFLDAARRAVPEADILVADDNSPDGTGALAEKLGAEMGGVHVLHRPGKAGLGAAYREAFAWALEEGYDHIVQMDCDLSHDPACIPGMFERIEAGADCVIGSRYVPGGSTPNWPTHRSALSRYGNRYTAALLGLDIRDCTSGFRAYRASTLADIHVGTTRSSGYAFMSELALRMSRQGKSLAEVPITFVDRAFGTSKMSARIIAESMLLVTAWGVRERVRRLKARR